MARLKGERYVITLCAMAHSVPAVLRLRALLKRALRDHQLRCTGVTTETSTASDDEMLNINLKDDRT
jgi:hypothetical protein